MVVRPLPVNISRMHRPESLFFHSGRTTTLGLVARIQSANRAILLPPPWQMLRLTIRMPIAETVRGLNDARRHSCRYRGIAAPGADHRGERQLRRMRRSIPGHDAPDLTATPQRLREAPMPAGHIAGWAAIILLLSAKN